MDPEKDPTNQATEPNEQPEPKPKTLKQLLIEAGMEGEFNAAMRASRKDGEKAGKASAGDSTGELARLQAKLDDMEEKLQSAQAQYNTATVEIESWKSKLARSEGKEKTTAAELEKIKFERKKDGAARFLNEQLESDAYKDVLATTKKGIRLAALLTPLEVQFEGDKVTSATFGGKSLDEFIKSEGLIDDTVIQSRTTPGQGTKGSVQPPPKQTSTADLGARIAEMKKNGEWDQLSFEGKKKMMNEFHGVTAPPAK